MSNTCQSSILRKNFYVFNLIVAFPTESSFQELN